MLNITDLTASKEMDRTEMTAVRGGTSPFAILDFSTGIDSKVADVDQGFGFGFYQKNKGAVTNIQAINGGNGSSWTPVEQNQYQANAMSVSGIGNVIVA